MEKVAYGFLIIVGLAWFIGILVGFIAAWPFGIFGLIGITAFGLLFVKALTDRLANKEDDYYSKNIQQ